MTMQILHFCQGSLHQIVTIWQTQLYKYHYFCPKYNYFCSFKWTFKAFLFSIYFYKKSWCIWLECVTIWNYASDFIFETFDNAALGKINELFSLACLFFYKGRDKKKLKKWAIYLRWDGKVICVAAFVLPLASFAMKWSVFGYQLLECVSGICLWSSQYKVSTNCLMSPYKQCI